jgi:hypothetical protein
MFYDCGVRCSWLDWMQQMFQWGGVLYDHGWLPRDMIKAIVPLNDAGAEISPDGKVVPFRKP